MAKMTKNHRQCDQFPKKVNLGMFLSSCLYIISLEIFFSLLYRCLLQRIAGKLNLILYLLDTEYLLRSLGTQNTLVPKVVPQLHFTVSTKLPS